VSGRPISDLDRLFSPLELTAVGGHGAEIRTAPGAHATRIAPLDPNMKSKFCAIANADPGIVVEDKGYSLALHYRLAPGLEDFVLQSAQALRASLPTSAIELLRGKSMVEIKQTGFTKASGVRSLMAHPPFAGRRPIFIGDDVTDEDVFEIMPEFDGIAISVGRRLDHVAHCFEQPGDVRKWLDHISRDGAFATS
jgi:trehalose 6-phosphate phosphatase